MKQIDMLKKGAGFVYRELILLFAPELLSPLHLASLYQGPQIKDKKRLFKLSRKMLRINTQFSIDKKGLMENSNIDDNVKLFYEVYANKEYLTLNELNSLYDFYSILRRLGYFCMIEYNDSTKGEIGTGDQYSGTIGSLIESKKAKRKIINNITK